MSIKIADSKSVDIEQLKYLFEQAGWFDKTNDDERLKSIIENSTTVITAWDENTMIGFARCTTDCVFNGQINNLVVDEKHRVKCIGRQLIERVIVDSEKFSYLLRGNHENEGVFKMLGFEKS